MNILIAQPKLEKTVQQLEREMSNSTSVDMVIFPEGYLNSNVEQACRLAKQWNTIIVTGYKNPKDRAIMINRSGKVVLDRAKYSPVAIVEEDGLRVGQILCDELVLQGMKGAEHEKVDLLVHPIGVGMFSEEQFAEWLDEARKMAVAQQTMVVGTSHADGSFRNSEVSIPIAYCVDKDGEFVFVAKNDTRTRILEMKNRQLRIAGE
jgi:hypothetical protein